MTNTITWKGVSSTTIDGLLICELPPITKPPLRVQKTTIDGRDGCIYDDLGYDTYSKSITIGLHGDFKIDKVIKYFSGEGELIFSNEPEKVYTAKVTDQIDYDRLVRFRKAKIKFEVQPYKHKHNEAYKEAQTATVSGTSIAVTDGAEAILKTFSIYGKSTQNGTPTPTTPVDIVSLCADGTIAVTVNDTAVDLPVANGLCGIPVTSKSLATYTDAIGKMWCADEVDIKRGLYIQRVKKITFSGEEAWSIGGKTLSNGTDWYYTTTVYEDAENTSDGRVNCTHYPFGIINNGNDINGISMVWKSIRIRWGTMGDVDGWKAWLREQKENGTPVEVTYRLATPIANALTEEEKAACESIKDISNGATITNDEDAHIKVEYFKPFEVFNEGLEVSKPKMVLRGSGTVEIFVNGSYVFDYTFPDGECEVVIDSEKEDAYLDGVLKNRNMLGEFPVLVAGTNIIGWSGDVESIEILPRSRWL